MVGWEESQMSMILEGREKLEDSEMHLAFCFIFAAEICTDSGASPQFSTVVGKGL